MIKLGFKGLIFLMGIQSLFGKLQSEGIISGSIKINYSVIQQKIIQLIMSEEVDGMIKKFDETENNYFETPRRRNYESDQTAHENRRLKIYHHVVQRGETLTNLGEMYGISWKVIQKANKIKGEKFLEEGQDIIIPVLQANVV